MELYLPTPGFLAFHLVNTDSFMWMKEPTTQVPGADFQPTGTLCADVGDGTAETSLVMGEEPGEGAGSGPREVPAYGQSGLAASAH